MKKLIHVSTPEELREGDVFREHVLMDSGEFDDSPTRFYWARLAELHKGQRFAVEQPFRWHPNGFEVEREPTEPVVWEGVISRYDDLIAQEVYQKLFVIGLGHKHRVTIEEIKE